MILSILGSGYDDDAEAHFNQTTQDYNAMERIDNLIQGLKVDGVWQKMDHIWVIQNVLSDSLLDIKGALSKTLVGSLTYTNEQGWEGWSTGGNYLNCNANNGPNSGTANWSCFAYARTNNVTSGTPALIGGWDTGSSDRAGIYYDHGNSLIVARCGGNTVKATMAASNPTGFFCCSRPSTTELRIVNNASSAAVATSEPGVLPSLYVYAGLENINGSPGTAYNGEISCWGIGGGLTSAECQLLRTRIQAYMDALGVGV